MWWHTHRKHISSFGETDESIQIGGGVSSVDYWQPRCAHQLLLLVVNAGYTMFWGSVKGTGYHFTRQFPLHCPSRASPCAISFQLESTTTHTFPHIAQFTVTYIPIISAFQETDIFSRTNVWCTPTGTEPFISVSLCCLHRPVNCFNHLITKILSKLRIQLQVYTS